MPKRRGRGRRKGAYAGRTGTNKGLPAPRGAAPSERRALDEKTSATAPAASRSRPQQAPTQLKISTEEQFRPLRSDLRRVGIITVALVALLLILSRVL